MLLDVVGARRGRAPHHRQARSRWPGVQLAQRHRRRGRRAPRRAARGPIRVCAIIADEMVAFAGGSGITPIISLVRTALASTSRRVRLFYANRGRDSVIFADALDRAGRRSTPTGSTVALPLSTTTAASSPRSAVESFVAMPVTADYYICGPAPFMDTVEAAVARGRRAPRGRVHLERFVVAPAPADVTDVASRRATDEVVHRPGSQDHHARPTGRATPCCRPRASAGLRAPASCETGSCGTCMAHDRRGQRPDAEQRRARRRRGGRGLGADLPVPADESHGPRGLRVEAE